MAGNVSTIENKKTLDALEMPEAKPILRLIEATKKGEEVVEKCYFCHQPIEIESFENVSFKFRCPCGKSNGFLNGI